MHIYTSVDIGSDTIKIVVCELFNDKLNLLAATSTKSKGIKKGLITNVNDAASSLKLAFAEIENMIGIKIKKTIVSIPSYFADFSLVKESIKINGENNVITAADVNSVLKAAAKSKELHIKEIVSVIPIDFTIDDKTGLKNPKGLIGDTLGVRAILVTTPKKNIYSVVNLLSSIGVEVVDISLNCLGNIFAFKTKEISEHIGAIINIGHETTEISIYNRGVIVKNSIIQLGGKNINNDISYMYKVNSETAIKLKEKFALAHKIHSSTSDFFEVETENNDKLKINQFEVSEIAMSRIEEILNLAKKEINILTNKPIKYIIITGGTSNMPHFNYIAEEVFGKKTEIGNIRLVGVRNNKYSSAIGNIIYFINKLKIKGQDYSMTNSDENEKISTVRKDYLNFSNNSMIGKVFGFFFGE